MVNEIIEKQGRALNMIENIYSGNEGKNNMKEESKLYKIPKNIRQVGQTQENYKIYVEDYVITFIRQLAQKDTNAYQVAVLLGEPALIDEIQYIFIKGAVEVKKMSSEEEIVLDQSTWSDIYEEIQKYFSETEIIGWVLARSGISWENEEQFKKIHIDNFSGQDKVFLTYDPIEKEENFFLYRINSLRKQRGYYIYYEKNIEMQNYLVERHKGEGVEIIEDTTTKSMRNVMEKKQQIKTEKKGRQGWYTLGGAVAAVIILASAYAINYPEQWEQVRQTMSNVTSQWMATTEDNSKNLNEKNADKEESTPVEVETGNVTTIKQEAIVGDRTEEEGKKQEDQNTNSQKEEGDTKEVSDVVGEKVNTETKDFYIVQKGDSLASISKKIYKTLNKVKTLQKINNIENPDEIFIGQKIILPQ